MPNKNLFFKLLAATFLLFFATFSSKVAAQCPTAAASVVQVCEDPAGLNSQITVTLNDGNPTYTSPPYTYILFNVVGPTPVSAPFGPVTVSQVGNKITFNGVPDGNYIVFINVTPPNCNVSIGGFGISVNAANAITLNKTADFNLLCNGDANASGTFTASGGTAPYNFVINSNTTGVIPTIAATTVSFSGGGQTGSISVTVTDAENCSTNATINVTEPAVLSASELHANPSCNGLSDGSINISALGGTPGYQYSIDGGLNFFGTPSFPGLIAGSYFVVVRDNNNCLTTPIPVTLTNVSSVTLTAFTATDPTCNNGTNGSITFTTFSGGTGPYTFSITGGAPFFPTATFNSLSQGSYSLVVRDNIGCLSTPTSVTLNNPAPITFSTTQTNVSCFGGTNGTITVTAAGGTGPYEFSSNNGVSFTAGANPFTFPALAAGGYNIVVRDANLCTSTATLVTITQPAAVLSFGTTQTNVTCFGASTGTITVTASGGTGPYEFSSNNGVSFTAGVNPFTFPALAAGGYNIVVRDANLCTSTATLVTITQPAAVLSFGTTQTNVSCFGGTNGTITVTAAGGTGPYEFSSNNGVSFTAGANPFTFPALAAGGYNIVVRDANLCTSTATLVTITQPAAVLSFGTTQTNVSCFGGTNGTITVTAAGGTGPYEFSSNNGVSFTAGANPFTFPALAAGGYNIVVRDANLCTSTATLVTITQPAAVLSFGTTQTNVTCFGASTGTITVTASGGTGPYEFSSNNGVSFTAGVNPFTFPALAAGGYNIVVRDANLCTSTATLVTITQPAAVLSFGTTQTNVSCFGGTNGTITVTAAGGTGPYEFSSNNGVSFTAGANPFTFPALAAGGYNIVVRDANLCTSTATLVTITQPAAVLSFGTTQTNVSCFGGADGTITVTAAGGTGPYEFSSNNGVSFTAGANPFTFPALTAGGYNIIVRDANLCTSTATLVTITQPAVVLSFGTTQTNVSCFGGADGTITVTAAGGTGPYEFSSNNGVSFTAGANPFTFPALAAGGYNIVVRDANLCTSTATLVTITQPAAVLSFGTTQTNVSCFGGADGTITVTASGGTGPYEFSSNNGVSFTAGANPFTFPALAAGGYNIVVRDANLCTTTATLVTITQPAAVLSFGATQTNVSCFGGADGTITVTAAGGTGPYEFSSDNGVSFTAGANPFTFPGLTAGGYNIIVRDANLCTSTATLVTITQPAVVLSFGTTQTNVSCFGGADGTITVTAAGGTGPYEFSSNNGVSFTAGANPFTFPALAAGGYNIVVRDANLCTSTATLVTITQPAAVLSFGTTQTNVSCFGGTNGTITVTAAGGTGPYEFSSNNGVSFTAGANPFTFPALAAGGYNIVVRDGNLCTATATLVTITQPASGVVVTSTSKTDATCIGVDNGSIQINSVTGGTPGYQYSVDNGVTFQVSNTFINLAVATYDVVARDANNCVSASVQVIVGTGLSFAPSATFTNASCSGVDDGTIQVNSVSGGTAPYNYSIDNGVTFQVSNSFVGLTPATYDVVARDVNGCLSTAQGITIGSGLSFDPLATPTAASCSGVNDGSIQVTGTTGGTAPFEYSNDGGATFQTLDTFTGLATGNYDIVVRDANTCISTTLVVNVGSGLTFDPLATPTAASCSGVNDGSIQVTGTTGGTAPFEYSNDGGVTFQTLDTFTGLATGNYDIVVRDANTCISTTLIVNVGSGLTFDPLATPTAASCSGVNDGSIQVTGTTGGTAPFEYSNDGGVTFQTLDTFTGLATGNYDIVVRDANTCISTTLIVNVGSGLTFDPQATPTAASCSGVNDGSIQVTGTTGGTAPFEYSNDGGVTFQTLDTFTGLAAGSYDIVVRDVNTCISTTLPVVVGNGLTITATVNKTDATCLGNDGSITVNSVLGGTGPYEYSINNGTTFQVSNVFNPVSVGNYNVIVRDANTCQSAVTPITINLPGGCGGLNCFAFTILPPVIQRPSCGNQNDGVVSLDITGQVAGNYIISLLIGGVAIGPPQIGPSGVYQFTSLSPADYQYRVQDQAGNICVQDFTLLVETTIDADASGFVDATCFGQATGQATITVLSGGSSPYDYSIDGNIWVLNKTSPILITDLPPSATPYSILVRDDASDQCPDEVTVTIGNGSPQIDIGLGTTSATCGNSDGAITITTPASGGSGGPYLYLLDGNSVTPVANAFANISGGSHILTVIDDVSDCQRDFPVVVPFPGIVATSSISTSSANCTAGGIISFFINTPGATTYQIGFTTDFFNEATNYSSAYYTPPLSPGDDGFVQISDLPRGDYYIWVKPSTGACTTRINSIPESVGGPYSVTFDIGCRETNGDLSLLNISGEPGVPITYEIFGVSTSTGTINLDPLNNAVITGFASDPYQVRLSQDQSASSGCVVTTAFVSAPIGALDILSVETNESFPDQPTGSMLVKITESGSEPYEIWLVESTIGFLSDTVLAVRNPVNFETKFTTLSAGSYSVYLEDGRGCRKETTVELPIDGKIFVPNIFTPNNDNLNEVFYVRNLPESGSKLVITNRWGKEVFTSSNYYYVSESDNSLWDGTGAPDGVYYYRLQISGGATYTGWVEVLRGNKP